MRPPRNPRRTAPVVVVAWLALLAGCASVPTTRYYVLERSHATAPRATGVAIGVLPFAVDAPYDQDRIVYRVGESSPEVGFYEYHRWAVPLARMVPRFVAASLGDVDGIARIEPAGADRTYDLRLVGRVLALEEVDTAAGQHVRVDLELALLETDGRTRWSARLSGRTESSADTVTGLVDETRDLVERLLGERRSELRAALDP